MTGIVLPTQAEIAAHAGCRQGAACKARILAEAEADGPVIARLDPYTVIACEECETPEAAGDRTGPPVRPARRDGP